YENLMSHRVEAGHFCGVVTALVQTIYPDINQYHLRGKEKGVVKTAFSVSSVMGVPVGLLFAAYSDWHAPFLAIGAVSFLLVVGGLFSLPAMADHLHHPEKTGARQNLKQVLRDSNHLRGFLFSFAMVFAGFSVIPYITLYMQINAGVAERDIPLIYLIGGGATLISAQVIGRLSDRFGKVRTLHVVSVIAMIPIGVLPFTEFFPFWLILVCSTAFFIFVSGRMIPGMALLTSASNPRLRGTFMTLNSSMQSAGMGLAAFVGGLIISRGPDGHLQYYWVCSLIALTSNALAMWVATRLEIRQ
ncbi:MAG: MFS transporter, partial [Limnobacter sp.]|nr:MFS transporter [Limnobacter sp.]